MNEAQDSDSLRCRIIKETAVIRWQELQGFFARGIVLVASNDLDLVDIALHIANDNKAAVETWCCSGQLAKASDQQAELWCRSDAALWAVVVKPWIIVQPYKNVLSDEHM